MNTCWWGKWIGLPFVSGGRGPAAYDCWGLVRAVMAEVHGIALPEHDGVDAGDALRIARRMTRGQTDGSFARVNAPRAFDVMLATHGPTSRLPGHAGIMIDDTRVLHIWRPTGSHVLRLSDPALARRVCGFFRHEALAGEVAA